MAYVVYGKENCPACDRAEELLTAAGKEYTYLQWDVDYSHDELYEATGIFTAAMPRIVYQDGDAKTVLKDLASLQEHLNSL